MGECRCLRCLHVQCSDQKACSNEPVTQRGGSPAALCFPAHSAPKMRTRAARPQAVSTLKSRSGTAAGGGRRFTRWRRAPRRSPADAISARAASALQTWARGSRDARVSVRGCVGRHREELLADVQIRVTCGVCALLCKASLHKACASVLWANADIICVYYT